MLGMDNRKLTYGLVYMRGADDRGGASLLTRMDTVFQTNVLIKCIYICPHLSHW